MSAVKCELFAGFAGKLVVVTLTVGAFFAYVGTFAVRRHLGRESRPWKIFWLDLSKMGVGQLFAYAVNVLNAHRNSASDFDPVSWYFPTFLNDEFIAVPLGVLLWHKVLLALARQLRRRRPQSGWLRALEASGKYHPTQQQQQRQQQGHAAAFVEGGGSGSSGSGSGDDPRAMLMEESDERACGQAGSALQSGCSACCCCCCEPSEVRCDWFLVQLFFWTVCVLASRLLGGLVVPACAAALGDASPYHQLAAAINALDWSCDAKRWTFAGVLRIVIDVLQLAVVDFFNKFKAPSSRG